MSSNKLPKWWVFPKLMECADTASGGTPNRSNKMYYGGDIPWVKSGELGDGIVSETSETITEEGLNSSSAKLFPAGTLCIAMYGATVGKVGTLAIPAATNQAVCGIFPHKEINTKFLKHYLFSIREHLISLGKGGAQPNISQTVIKNLELPFPPLNEQRRIADKIDALQSKSRTAREALEKVQPLLEKFRQSVLSAAFRGDLTAELRKQNHDVEPASELLERIRVERRQRWEEAELAKMEAKGKTPKNDKWKDKYKEPEPVDTAGLPELPQGWCWASLGEIIVDGPQNGLYVPKNRYGDGTRILRIDDYQAGWIRAADSLQRVKIDEADVQRYALSEDSVVVNRVNSISHLGKTTVIKTDMLPLVFESNMMAFSVSKLLVSDFVDFFFNSDQGRYQLVKNAKHAVNQASINQKDVQAALIPIPSQDEIVVISTLLKKAFKNISSLCHVVEQGQLKLSSLNQSILAKAFRGELVPQDPNDEPASVLLERIKAEREAQKGKGKKGAVRRRKALKGLLLCVR